MDTASNATSGFEERRLISAQADGVLGEFDHRFDFESPGQFAIVYGPNGVGKTRVLEIINALCNMNVMRLSSLPFRSAELKFSDGSRFRVTRISGVEAKGHLDIDGITEPQEKVDELEFCLWNGARPPVKSRVSTLNDFQVFLQQATPYEPTDDPDIWIDPNDGELVSFEHLERRHLPRFHARNSAVGNKKRMTSAIDPAIRDYAKSLDVRLIETQRLLGLSLQEVVRTGDRHPFRENSPHSVPTIIRYSDQIKQSLDNNLSANSRLTQSLDSTFPRRMLERGDKSVLTEQELRNKWAEQTTRRARLTEIADLNVDPELSLPEGSLNSWQLGMLELYLEDADKKLDSFSNVLERINLLEEIVNARLLRKSLHVDANDGLVVTRELDGSSVPLTALSSGEQHEIILMFDLLFNVQPGSLVMIDEPEISLHIGWQKKFIADVLRISDLVGFQFVVATHSPQIIDRWWSNATRLGPTLSGFLSEEETADDAR
ncbi:AAA family ATPase [Arthrobacter sp. ISL-85]|uniref:AAA family ATPase n=1 Tax=Arthrobacter sp. ISL-85 TaxID=2819115 RepID=UPI001BECE312|nr:AAA family ATPase [Arthrobacter sp. ISL-85]MBT2565130.1 AAA family ATPase [Arthrobacter sp. ISL-85]